MKRSFFTRRTLYTLGILFFSLLLAAGCRTRKGNTYGSGKYGSGSGTGLINDGMGGSASDPAGYVNVAGTELGDWSFEGGYNEQGQYVGAGGLFDSSGQWVGDTGGYDENGNFVGEKGFFNSKGEWFGPGGGYDKNGNFVGLGGMYDKNGKYVGLAQRKGGIQPRGMVQRTQAPAGAGFRDGQTMGLRPIYFGYDQDNIPYSEVGAIDALAQKLKSSGGQVLLEGHCDERGSKAYNLGLGERRAQAVRTELIGRGVSAGRVTTTSFGSEQPASPGHNESAWRQNRRVNFQFY